jgi:hypothetical protein
MSSNVPDEMNSPRFSSPLLPTIGAIVLILVNAWVVWFLLYSIPSGCTRLAAETGGRQTCGLEFGAYVIAAISALLILAGVYYILKWNVKRAP